MAGESGWVAVGGGVGEGEGEGEVEMETEVWRAGRLIGAVRVAGEGSSRAGKWRCPGRGDGSGGEGEEAADNDGDGDGTDDGDDAAEARLQVEAADCSR